MSNSFIRMNAVSAKGKVLRVKSINVPIKLCMLSSQLENLVWKVMFYWILWFRFVHFLIHNSASVSFRPSVLPYLPEIIVPKDLSGGGIAAELIRLFFASTLFSKAVSMIVSSYVSMSRNPL